MLFLRHPYPDDIPHLQRRLKRHKSPVQCDLQALRSAFDISQAHIRRDSLNSRYEINLIPRMNNRRKFSFLLINEERRRLRRRTVEYFPFSVHCHRQARSGTSQNILKIIPVHHQQIQRGKTPASKKLGRSAV